MKNARLYVMNTLIVLALIAFLYFTPNKWLVYLALYTLFIGTPVALFAGKLCAFNDKPPTWFVNQQRRKAGVAEPVIATVPAVRRTHLEPRFIEQSHA